MMYLILDHPCEQVAGIDAVLQSRTPAAEADIARARDGRAESMLNELYPRQNIGLIQSEVIRH